ncbi:phosphoheptose isomerase [Candidatus Fermentibacteria bacterium]|nr:MAG: phosphoheptose isomerase [Candidatus Fermentibacteria bacterium]
MYAEIAVKNYFERARTALAGLECAGVAEITAKLAECVAAGGKILICGNGGSASDASHLAGELIGRFRKERAALPAIALTTDPAVLTALGNDYGYHSVFRRQVEGLGNPGDILIAITTSGTSSNVVSAAEAAALKGMSVIAFTSSASERVSWADIQWKATCPETSHAQEQMLVVFHALCHGLEAVFEQKN